MGSWVFCHHDLAFDGIVALVIVTSVSLLLPMSLGTIPGETLKLGTKRGDRWDFFALPLLSLEENEILKENRIKWKI